MTCDNKGTIVYYVHHVKICGHVFCPTELCTTKSWAINSLYFSARYLAIVALPVIVCPELLISKYGMIPNGVSFMEADVLNYTFQILYIQL